MADNTYTTTTAPWASQVPYLQQIFGSAQNLYGQGGPQYYPGSTIAPLGQETNAALNNITGYVASNPHMTWANPAYAQTTSGGYLNANPYIDQTFNRAADAVTRQFGQGTLPGINAAFSMAGRAGSGAHQNAADWAAQTYGRNLNDLATNIYGGNYANERALQQQAVLAAPQMITGNLNLLNAGVSAGGARDEQAQKQLSDEVARYQFGQLRPYDALSRYLQAITGNYGGSSSQPLYGQSGWEQALGGLGAGLGILQQLKII